MNKNLKNTHHSENNPHSSQFISSNQSATFWNAVQKCELFVYLKTQENNLYNLHIHNNRHHELDIFPLIYIRRNNPLFLLMLQNFITHITLTRFIHITHYYRERDNKNQRKYSFLHNAEFVDFLLYVLSMNTYLSRQTKFFHHYTRASSIE